MIARSGLVVAVPKCLVISSPHSVWFGDGPDTLPEQSVQFESPTSVLTRSMPGQALPFQRSVGDIVAYTLAGG
ncbi:hypothetical protein ACQGAO_31845 [Rhodococcus sp. 1.20]